MQVTSEVVIYSMSNCAAPPNAFFERRMKCGSSKKSKSDLERQQTCNQSSISDCHFSNKYYHNHSGKNLLQLTWQVLIDIMLNSAVPPSALLERNMFSGSSSKDKSGHEPEQSSYEHCLVNLSTIAVVIFDCNQQVNAENYILNLSIFYPFHILLFWNWAWPMDLQ